MTREETVEKLKKIKKHAESAAKIGNEAEAQAFATKLTELMAQHNVEMSELEWEEERKAEAVETRYSLGKKKVMEWEARLASIIAQGNFCRVLLSRSWERTDIKFIGLRANVEAALQTAEYLYPAAKRIAHTEYNKRYDALYAAHESTACMKGYEHDFLLGFVVRLGQRYDELQESLRSAKAGCALVRLTDAMMVANKALEAMKGISKHAAYQGRGIENYGAFMDGKQKANEMNVGGASLHSPTPPTPSNNGHRLTGGW